MIFEVPYNDHHRQSVPRTVPTLAIKPASINTEIVKTYHFSSRYCILGEMCDTNSLYTRFVWQLRVAPNALVTNQLHKHTCTPLTVLINKNNVDLLHLGTSAYHPPRRVDVTRCRIEKSRLCAVDSSTNELTVCTAKTRRQNPTVFHLTRTSVPPRARVGAFPVTDDAPASPYSSQTLKRGFLQSVNMFENARCFGIMMFFFSLFPAVLTLSATTATAAAVDAAFILPFRRVLEEKLAWILYCVRILWYSVRILLLACASPPKQHLGPSCARKKEKPQRAIDENAFEQRQIVFKTSRTWMMNELCVQSI